jgi:hypothetical protein
MAKASALHILDDVVYDPSIVGVVGLDMRQLF